MQSAFDSLATKKQRLTYTHLKYRFATDKHRIVLFILSAEQSFDCGYEVGKGLFPDCKPEDCKSAESCNRYGAYRNSHDRTRGQTALIGFGSDFAARFSVCSAFGLAARFSACGFVFVYRGQTDFTADGKGVNFFGADDVAVPVFPA